MPDAHLKPPRFLPPQFLVLAALPVFAGAALAAQASGGRVSDSIIQIGIVREAGQITLRPEGKFSAVDQKTGDTYELEPYEDYLLLAAGGRDITLGDYHFKGQLRLIPADLKSAMRVGKKKYRGSLLVKPKSSRAFTVINEIGIEEYLYGVVPAEMNSGWPMEALKAQAVVARTFALANLGKFRTEGYDLTGDTASQSYADLDKRSADATRAVDATRGQVLTWKGQILKAYFHSCCGGHTGNVGIMWGSMDAAPKPLRGVSDRFCRISPEYEWSGYFAADAIADALRRHGFIAAKVQGVRVGQRDYASNYAKTMRIRAGGKWIEVRASDFRSWLGNRKFKSTKIYRIVSKRRGFIFVGRGYGHGVGLCQWGAKAIAGRGRNYKAILNFYFPGAKLVTRED